MDSHVLVVIGLGAAGLAADVTRVRPRARVHSQMLLEIVRAVEGLVADVARVRLVLLVLLHVPQAVVLADELRAAVVARVRPHVPMGIHVGRVIAVTVERRAALITLERLGAARRVRPLVQLQVPLGAERLGADLALVRPLAVVHAHVHRQRRSQVDALADRALDVLALALGVGDESAIVSATHVTRQAGHVDEPLVAVRARLRLLVVRLLVPGELLLRVEHLAAVAYVVLELLLDVEVMPVLVLGQIRVSAEGLVAQATPDGRVAGVAVGVLLQLLLGEERLVAHGTWERLDAQMALHVKLEVLLAVKILAALPALQRMYLQVGVEQEHRREFLVAYLALGGLAYAFVHVGDMHAPMMRLQRLLAVESLIANRANHLDVRRYHQILADLLVGLGLRQAVRLRLRRWLQLVQERLLMVHVLLHVYTRHEYIVEHVHATVQQLDVLHLRLVQLVSTATGHRILVHRCAMNSTFLRTIKHFATVGTLECSFGWCLPVAIQKQTRSKVRGQRSTVQQRPADLVVGSF